MDDMETHEPPRTRTGLTPDPSVRGGEVLVLWRSEQPFAPDRVRSLLQHLQKLTHPLAFSSFPANLYIASETLARGGELPLSCGPQGDSSGNSIITVSNSNRHSELALSFGPLRRFLSALRSPAILDLLVAGARMLACESASICITAGSASSTRPAVIPPIHIAVWLSAKKAACAQHDSGMTLLKEEWDGAKLLLNQSSAFDPRHLISALIASAAGNEALTPILGDALRSPDWQTRMCAIIGSTRRRIRPLGLLVKRAEIPSAGTPGVTNALRHNLLAIQKASLLLLTGAAIPEMQEEAPDTRPGMQAHLLRAIMGLPLSFRDEFSELIDSFLGGTP